jgi:hypothetical protein
MRKAARRAAGSRRIRTTPASRTPLAALSEPLFPSRLVEFLYQVDPCRLEPLVAPPEETFDLGP